VAQGVRTRRRLKTHAALAAATLAAACGGDAAPPLPDEPRAAIDAVLARCHGTLRGSLDRITVELREGDRTGLLRTIDLAGPHVRVRAAGGGSEVLGSDGAWRTLPDGAAQPLDDAARADLVRLRDLVAAAYLAPLYAAVDVQRPSADEFVLRLADGAQWQLRLAPTRLPLVLAGPPGTVRFVSWLSTGVTELPADVELDVLGRCHLTLLAQGVTFAPQVFAAPGAPSPATRVLPRAADETPELVDLEARTVLVLDDPGDWPGRVERIVAAAHWLEARGRTNAGLPFLFTEGDRGRIGVPFAAAAGADTPLTPRAGESIQQRAAQRALVLVRGKAEFDASCAAGTRAVTEHAARLGLTPTGPLRILPYLAWDRGTPTAAELAAVRVRFELPVGSGK